MRAHLLLLLFSLALLAGRGAAQAQPLDECSRIGTAGREHMQAGRLDDARRAFEQAYALCHDATLLYNLGRVAHKAGQPADAASYYQRYLDERGGTNPVQIQKAQEYLAQARREAAEAKSGSLGLASASSRPQDVGTAPTPVYKKWWLWTLVGVGVAGVAVGVGVGVAARRPDLSGAAVATPFP